LEPALADSRGGTALIPGPTPFTPAGSNGVFPTSYDLAAAFLARAPGAGAPVEPSSPSQPFLDSYGQNAHLIRREFIAYRTAQGAERHAAFERFFKEVSKLNTEARQAGFAGLSLYLSSIQTRVGQLLNSLDLVTRRRIGL
jgi:hypothetical protein